MIEGLHNYGGEVKKGDYKLITEDTYEKASAWLQRLIDQAKKEGADADHIAATEELKSQLEKESRGKDLPGEKPETIFGWAEQEEKVRKEEALEKEGFKERDTYIKWDDSKWEEPCFIKLYEGSQLVDSYTSQDIQDLIDGDSYLNDNKQEKIRAWLDVYGNRQRIEISLIKEDLEEKMEEEVLASEDQEERLKELEKEFHSSESLVKRRKAELAYQYEETDPKRIERLYEIYYPDSELEKIHQNKGVNAV